jgi:uncharacterized membrane protein
MWEELMLEILRSHRGKLFGAVVGLIFALLVIALGFFQAVFIACCIFMGYIIGKRVDDNESIREIMERIFKER